MLSTAWIPQHVDVPDFSSNGTSRPKERENSNNNNVITISIITILK